MGLGYIKKFFAIAGLICVLIGLGWAGLRLRALLTWPSVAGKVVESRLISPSGQGEDTTYTPAVAVAWEANGTRVTKEFREWGGSSASSMMQKIVDRYPAGSSLPVLYNPAQPDDAYVEAGYHFWFFSFPIMIVLFGVGLGSFGWLIEWAIDRLARLA